MTPKISVIMTVYNSAEYIHEAIESVINQTFSDFEFIIINDASTDSSLEIINCFSDNRITVMNNEENKGAAFSSNLGLRIASGKYIIRMDSDDISLLNRFEEQVKYMDQHDNIDVLGTWVKCFGHNIPNHNWEFPQEHTEIRANQLFNPKIHHSSVIMRKSTLDKYKIEYNPKYSRALDYEFWIRNANKLRFANMNEIFLLYRRHPNQMSTGYFNEQQNFAGNVRLIELDQLRIKPDQNEFIMHQEISNNSFEDKGNIDYLYKIKNWLERINESNKKLNYYSQDKLEEVLSLKWAEVCSTFSINNKVAIQIWSNIYSKFLLYNKIKLPENKVKASNLQKWMLNYNEKNILILGTGRAALNLYWKLKDSYNIVGFIDNNTNKQGTKLFDLFIYSNVEIKNISKDCIVISSILGSHDQEVMASFSKENPSIPIISWRDLL